jgi:hypothetical protein
MAHPNPRSSVRAVRLAALLLFACTPLWPAPRAEAGHVYFYLCTVVVGEANLANLSAVVIPEL